MFNGKLHYKWPFSIAMLNYQRVDTLLIQKNVRRQPGRLVDAAQSAGAPTNGLVVDTAGRQRMPLGSWKNRWKSQVISELSSWCSVMWNYWSYWRVCAVYIIYICTYRCDLLENILLESIYCKLLDSILLESILLESIYIWIWLGIWTSMEVFWLKDGVFKPQMIVAWWLSYSNRISSYSLW